VLSDVLTSGDSIERHRTELDAEPAYFIDGRDYQLVAAVRRITGR
jgi:hypothetical protein